MAAVDFFLSHARVSSKKQTETAIDIDKDGKRRP